MIEVKETSLQSMLDKAIDEAKEKQTSQLMSITKKIHKIDPLLFFEAGKKLAVDRTFWSSTAEDFHIAGVGSAFHLKAESNRLEQAETSWQKLLDEAMIHNPYETPGTGLVTMGGMSFDPTTRKSALWKNFSHLSFTVPNFMLTQWDDTCYLTINIQAGKNDDASELADELNEKESMLLHHSTYLPEGAHIKANQEIEPDEWKEKVKFATDYIKDNNADKIVLARELVVKLTDKAVASSVLNKLIAQQPNSYVFAFERNGDCFIGASPERLVRQDKKEVLSTCLAGTAPRGKTRAEDDRIGHSLFNDEKNRSEHDFVVQMIRQSMEHYCRAVHVPDKPVIYPLKNLQHLYTPVTATLNEGYSIFDIIGKLHPTPALGGVPRDESLAFIREHEQLDRGWYGAPVGWLDSNHNGEFAVAIRSGLIQGDQASLFAGCGIVKDSNPEAEYDETNIKFLPMLSVLEAER
ncbi:isochorismate synthase MenF [Lentibacillus sp. CBA3610]|uniref:isochorismate synthase n=1 Tax=Lentibacillus sp. CBA3610 TaxID=2518176 RepID=UPI001594FFA7|nr:isochorismate synthase [Lentibacillus sp. CBA3610]QKY69762.1 isochorismate synthase [Lentibacillus sp. CBA3610]